MMDNKQQPVSVVILGAGHRSHCYAELALRRPDLLQIVGVADLDPKRVEYTAKRFNLTKEQCFASAADFFQKGRIADAVINGTGDAEHVPTTLPLLEMDYDVLLEKPFAISSAEVETLISAAAKSTGKVMICHVLRYAPFYVAIKKHILAGDLGDIMSITTAEHVSYHHYAGVFVRGRWHRYVEGRSTFLMQKCCHDLDLITWFMSGVAPIRVFSLGSLSYFTRAHAPKNSGTYCMVDCHCEKECLYSAGKLILDYNGLWLDYLMPELVYTEHGKKEIEAGLRDTSRPCGKCVFKLDNDLVDRQHVSIEFANGVMATHELVGGTSRPMRKIHIVGSKGELYGIFDDQKYTVCHPAPGRQIGEEYTLQDISMSDVGDVSGAKGGHGGADELLPYDFVSLVRNEPHSVSCTVLEDSINGHRIGFAADKAMREHRVVELY